MPATPTVGKVAKRIFSRRSRAGLTQEALAQKLGTSRRHVLRWEKGISSPRPEFRRRLAATLGGEEGDYANGADEEDESDMDELLVQRIRLTDKRIDALLAERTKAGV